VTEFTPVPAGAIRRILVGSDFSDSSRRAVCRAGQLAKQHEAQLHLIHAQPDWNLFSRNGAPDYYRAVTDDSAAALTTEVAFIEKAFGIHARAQIRVGTASQVLRAALTEIQPHLIVVSARGEHDSARNPALLGGTTLKLVTFARLPVLIVRNRDALKPYQTAVVAVERSLADACHLIHLGYLLVPEGDCHLVHVYAMPYLERLRLGNVSEETLDSWRQAMSGQAKIFVDELRKQSTDPQQRMHAHVVCDEPVTGVLAQVNRLKPDLVLVGKHQHTGREHLTSSLGSVALRIAYHATVDLLVVP
jgi:universal stress protein E